MLQDTEPKQKRRRTNKQLSDLAKDAESILKVLFHPRPYVNVNIFYFEFYVTPSETILCMFCGLLITLHVIFFVLGF